MRVFLNGFAPANNSKVIRALIGNRDMRSEEILSNEFGYRIRANDRLLFDMTTFFNKYDWLRTNEPVDEFPILPDSTRLTLLQANNLMDGKTYGFEIAADWLATNRVKFKAGYSFLKIDLQVKTDIGGKNFIDEGSIPGQSPINQLFLRSAFDLHRNVELDLNLRYVDSLPSLAVEEYLQADLRLGWRFHPNLQLVILGRDLLTDHYQQMTQNLDPTNENTEIFPVSASSDVQRSIAVKLNASF
jgi:iron complex outermembrane receptor protein